MADTVSPRAAKERAPSRKPRTKKHVAAPATAEQILKGVGVTKKDSALVRKVLLQLGYIQQEGPSKSKRTTSRVATAKSKKG